MNQTDEIQVQIINEYIEKFKNYKGGLSLSTPLIPRISDNFLKNRTVVIGQETNTWYNTSNDDLKNDFVDKLKEVEENCLKGRYDHFIQNYASTYTGKFWEFNSLICAENYRWSNG